MLNSQFKPVEGKIVYKKSEEDAKMKEISFKNAYIVHYKETLDVNNERPCTIVSLLRISRWAMPSWTTVGLAHKETEDYAVRAFARHGPLCSSNTKGDLNQFYIEVIVCLLRLEYNTPTRLLALFYLKTTHVNSFQPHHHRKKFFLLLFLYKSNKT